MHGQPVNRPNVFGGGYGIAYDDRADTGRRGQWACDGTSIVRTYTVRLKVFMYDYSVGPIAIIKSLPARIGDSYRYPLAGFPTEQDTGSFLQSISLDEFTVDGKQCVATLEYAPLHIVDQLGSSYLNDGVIDPTEHVPLVEWSDAKYEITRDRDYSYPDQLPFVNTNGDPLLDPPSTEETRPILTFTRNEDHYNEFYASSFKDCVNGDMFLGFPRNTVKCKSIKGERMFDSDWGYYWRVSYQFEFRDTPDNHGFDQLIMNAGYRQKVNGTGNPVQITVAGKDITDAVALQMDGSYDPNADPFYIPFKMYPEADFTQLNIPEELFMQ